MSTQMKAYIDKLLSGVLQSYNPEGMCIAEKIFPQVQTAQYSGKLGKLTNSHLRIQNTVMGGKGAARRVDVIVRDADSYNIESHGLEGIVTPRDIKNWDDPFDAEKEEAMGLGLGLLLGKEKSIADSLSSTSIITQNTDLSAATQFDDYANSDPLSYFKTAHQTVEDAVGMAPNVAIMNAAVRRCLRFHPAIIEFVRGKVQPGARLNDDELAAALDVDRILVGGAKYNSAKEGQTDALSNLWGNNIQFLVAPSKAEIGQISAGYYVTLKGSAPRQVRKQSVFNPPDSTQILVTDDYDYLLNAAGVYLLANVI